MRYIPRLLAILLTSLLAACATIPMPAPSPTSPPGSGAASSAPSPAVSASSAETPSATPTDAGDVWNKLRGSFAMSDCDADPQIMVWAHRFTQSPQRFEAEMNGALSQLVYIQQIAAKYNVAGEFVLLPWVESQYRPVSGHRNLPAGMWQIVPSTAHVIGLHVGKKYDGRLDTSASTDSVMRMLRDYYRQLHDWRLVDYAFNHGEYGVQRLIQKHGMPPDEPAIPRLPVPRHTREHLTKLLAISCVVRDPSRFNVALPTLPADQHLETVQVHQGMTLSGAADHAGMELDVLKRLNPAIRNDLLDANLSEQLLMPRHNAEQLRSAMLMANSQHMTASLTTSDAASYLSDDADQPAAAQAHLAPATTRRHARTHTVRSGETLWVIARHYSTTVAKLERLNKLHGKMLKPGQVLKLDSP